MWNRGLKLEVGLQADIAKAAIHPKWTTAAWVDLTVGQTAADREYVDGGGLGNPIWILAEQVLRTDRDRILSVIKTFGTDLAAT